MNAMPRPSPEPAPTQPFASPLYLWLSPGFPVGAFAYSHGLEWAIADGPIRDRDGLCAWLTDIYEYGSARNDMIFAALAYRTAGTDGVVEIADLAVALQPGSERRAETIAQGNAFAQAIEASWPCATIAHLVEARGGEIAYPVALGVAAAGHAQPRDAMLTMYGLAFAANLVSAAQRLSLIGQTDGQKVLAALAPVVAAAAGAAARAGIDDLAGGAFVSDVASLLHETMEQRMFRT